jgi:hypothetical protein
LRKQRNSAILPREAIHLAPSDNYEGWPAIGEVMARTGMSERSVYRAVSDGRLRAAQQPLPGRKPLPVYHPEDVDALERAAAAGKTTIMRPAAMAAPRQDSPPPEFWRALIEAVRPHPAALPQPAESPDAPVLPELPPLAELRQKLIVTRAEAKRLGFTARILEAVERFPGNRYKMRDLEAL